MLHVCFGPPGAGKTRFGQRLVEEHVKAGTDISAIAFLSFTKAAATVAAERCGVDQDQMRDLWFRTIHSACYRLLRGPSGKGPRVLTSKLKQEFADQYGLRIKAPERPGEESLEDLYWDVLKMGTPQSEGDSFFSVYSLSRLCCRTAGELDEAKREQHPRTLQREAVDPRAYRNFVEIYEGFKRSRGVVDFVDMLALVLENGCAAPKEWELAVIDEAQDCCPLIWAVAERLFFNARNLFLIGDDDQALYSFMMSAARDFLAYRSVAGQGKVYTLQQTYRFGKEIVEFAGKIVERIDERQPKNVIPMEGKTHRVTMEYEFDPTAFEAAVNGSDSTGLVLHRHVAGCKEIGKRFMEEGIPYWNERGVNPLAKGGEKNGYLAWRDLCGGRKITREQLLYLIEVIPSRKGTVPLVYHGLKTKIKDQNAVGLNLPMEMGPADLKDVFTETLLGAVTTRDPQWLHVEHRDYYERLLKRGFDLAKDRARIVVSTIHGAKGREAEVVALFSETFPKALAGGDDEHRVAYVGATRTKRDLWIVREPVVADWTREYPYPMK